MGALTAAASNDPGTAGTVFIIIAGVLLYWVPSIIAGIRRVPHLGSVIVINFFLGWTLIGWIVALAMAFRSRAPQTQQPS